MSAGLVLASGSPRRKRILESLGIEFAIAVPDVEEVFYSQDPRRTAQENGRQKSLWARERFPDAVVIAADTVIDFRGECVTKPRSPEEAIALFRMFSGRCHSVLTAVVYSVPGDSPREEVVESRVMFKVLVDADIVEYFSHVDPMDKAGAYDIDERPDLIIESFSGSRTNIMGLPDELVRRWLAGATFNLDR